MSNGDGVEAQQVEHVDVLVVGAGLSGIGATHYLRTMRPDTRFVVLEARADLGGTWDLFRYPGVRSDSDLHTFGYEFKPWLSADAIASGPRILDYLRETAAEEGLAEHVRYHHRVVSAAWSSAEARWDVQVQRTDTGERLRFSAAWLFAATGYYRYDEGYTPQLTGLERFEGPVVHPQHWPEDLDLTGRRVLVVGSGATAMTIVPAVSGTAGHVTMLQRTPTYVLPMPSEDALAAGLRRRLGPRRAHAVARRANIARGTAIYQFCRRFPKAARRLIRSVNAKRLPEGFDVDRHFNPPYDPWTQRLCAVPDGDLFREIRHGRVDVVTDRVDTFTPTGVRLESGRELDADVVVTATGLQVLAFGGIAFTVDGEPVDLAGTVAYKGMMLSGVPNLAYAIGYTNSSWTLKIGLLCEHFCRLLAHMDASGYDTARPEVDDPTMATRSFLDFGAGYIQRSVGLLPRQGDRTPWQTSSSYSADVRLLRSGGVTHPELHLSTAVPDPSGDRFVDLPGDLRICYRVDGPDDGPVLVLLAGLGLDLTSWPQPMVDGFVARGFRVVRPDNRDAGRSSRVRAGSPGFARQLLARPRRDAYDLADMAADTVGLLDHLGVPAAHLLGMSLGGMIAQTVAARYPDRVLTLTSVFSTTGERRVGQPARSTLLRMAQGPSRDVEQSVARHLSMLRHIGSSELQPDEQAERAWAEGLWRRAGGRRARSGIPRQISAIHASGDRTAELARVVAPTLVVHGSRDRMVHPGGGEATARAIRGARHVVVPGMGHHLAPGVVERLVELTSELAGQPSRSVAGSVRT